MNRRLYAGALLLAATLLWSQTALGQELEMPAVCFYQDGQAIPAARTVDLSGVPQADAELLVAELLAGPTRAEQEEGITSALPAGTELLDVTVSGSQVVVDLLVPFDFLHTELDPVLSDAIVRQIVRTLEPLGLADFQVRAEDKEGTLVPISDFLRVPPLPEPTIPDNDEPLDTVPPGVLAQILHRRSKPGRIHPLRLRLSPLPSSPRKNHRAPLPGQTRYGSQQ